MTFLGFSAFLFFFLKEFLDLKIRNKKKKRIENGSVSIFLENENKYNIL
jgi:hypothetical protein